MPASVFIFLFRGEQFPAPPPQSTSPLAELAPARARSDLAGSLQDEPNSNGGGGAGAGAGGQGGGFVSSSVGPGPASSSTGGMPLCGDGVVDSGEQCDDGNPLPGDACVFCANAFCGDGFTWMGGVLSGLPFPGNWTIDIKPIFSNYIVKFEFIDGDDSLLSLYIEPVTLKAFDTPSPCRLDCTIPMCGDGVLDGGELCDDGNTQGGDGCAADCKSLN